MSIVAPESLIADFRFEKLLNQGLHRPQSPYNQTYTDRWTDQAGRRIVLQGTIHSQPALLLAERAAFTSDPSLLSVFTSSLSQITNLGDNDVYRWYLANQSHTALTTSLPDDQTTHNADDTVNANSSQQQQPHDLKINLIYPCDKKHIAKYSPQRARLVTETPLIYANYVRPYIEEQRASGRLNWVFNIIEGRTEQENVLYRSSQEDPSSSSSNAQQTSSNDNGPENTNFLLLPDLNWDRKTMTSLHLLALVERRDIWSLRDLRKKHVPWLRTMIAQLLDVVKRLYGPSRSQQSGGSEEGVDPDEVKLYLHYHPTYYHMHIHIVHISLEAGATQAVGKAVSLQNIVSQLETMAGGPEAGLADVEMSFTIGEAGELWKRIFGPLKMEERPGMGV